MHESPLKAATPAETGPESMRDIEALGRVASVVGHELTNVLQILSSSVDRLADPVTASTPVLRMARASLDRGVRLARQLQSFGRSNPPRVRRVDTHQALAIWLPAFEQAVGADRSVELRLRQAAPILVDPDQFQTAIVHLLTNARDATPPGSVIVVELTRVERSAGPACRVAIVDRGEGMTDDVARQAVEPFYTTRAPGHGLGLGLTIARMIAESHGGFLEIDSAVGLGTTVAMSFPLAHGESLGVPAPVRAASATAAPPSAAAAVKPAAPQRVEPRQAPASLPGETAVPASRPPVAPVVAGRVLVVDDEEAIAEYFRIILAAEHYDVSVVASMHRAVDVFTRDPSKFDVVLLDMMLGDGTGLDLYRRVKQMRPDLPVVVCTGFAENDALELIRADGHEVLLKPCTRSDVIRAIGRALARRQRA